MRDFPMLHENCVIEDKYKFLILTIFIDSLETKIDAPESGWSLDKLKETIINQTKDNLWCAYLGKNWIGSSQIGSIENEKKIKMFGLKISKQLDHFNHSSWFELYEFETGEVLHDARSFEECEDYAKTLAPEYYLIGKCL